MDSTLDIALFTMTAFFPKSEYGQESTLFKTEKSMLCPLSENEHALRTLANKESKIVKFRHIC